MNCTYDQDNSFISRQISRYYNSRWPNSGLCRTICRCNANYLSVAMRTICLRHSSSVNLEGVLDIMKNDLIIWEVLDVTVFHGLRTTYLIADHYSDVTMGAMAFQISSLPIVYLTVYSGADQRKHQSSAPLAFARGIHWWLMNSPHKWPVTRKMFPSYNVIMMTSSPMRVCHALDGIWFVWRDIFFMQVIDNEFLLQTAEMTIWCSLDTKARISWCRNIDIAT